MLPTDRLRHFVAESLPLEAGIHSYHVDLNWDPKLGKDPSRTEFGQIALHELHHLAAVEGALIRQAQGDPMARSSIGLNLARFMHRRGQAMELLPRFVSGLQNDPRAQAIVALIEQGNRIIQAYMPVIRQTISATGWQRAAPELFS